MAISIYWNLYYLTFTYVISFYAQKVSIWLIMLMIVPFTILVDLLMKLLINCKNDSRIIIDWYVSNYLKPNSDNKLNFKTLINKLCKKASQKLHDLAWMSNFMSCQQKKTS